MGDIFATPDNSMSSLPHLGQKGFALSAVELIIGSIREYAFS